jgi:chemotaxis protein methyltransferase CheR
MDPAVFRDFSKFVYDQAGIDLPPGKEALVSGRIRKRMRALEIVDDHVYLEYVKHDATGEELIEFLDAISTNFTQFFREPDHFDRLAKFVEERFADGRTRTLRIWSAASSTGEEPYSIAMTARQALEAVGADHVDFRLLATDISTRVLRHAQAGRYEKKEIESVPPMLRGRYLHRDPAGGEYVVTDELRQLVTFRRLNLSTPPFPMKGPFDVVFCRNVMIYFDKPVRARLLAEIERLLSPRGLLMVGHTESLAGIPLGLRMIQPSVYQKDGV